MKLKYYLRGLGIGIVVTALLMGFATKGKVELSDEEIKARAAELGMVEQVTLADIRENSESENQTETPEATNEPTATKAPVTEQPTEVPVTPTPTEAPEVPAEPTEATKPPADRPENTETPEATEAPEGPQASEATKEPGDVEPTSEPDTATEEPRPLPPTAEVSGDMVYVTIHEGNNSVNVSRALEEAGLIEDATAFDRYLRNNGYSKIINTGSYKIRLGTSEAEIAGIITNTN